QLDDGRAGALDVEADLAVVAGGAVGQEVHRAAPRAGRHRLLVVVVVAVAVVGRLGRRGGAGAADVEADAARQGALEDVGGVVRGRFRRVAGPVLGRVGGDAEQAGVGHDGEAVGAALVDGVGAGLGPGAADGVGGGAHLVLGHHAVDGGDG